VIVPTVVLPPGIPETVQFTRVLFVPVTEAVNCADASGARTIADGETATATEEVTGALIVMIALADALGSETLVATTLAVVSADTVGAVYNPEPEILPRVVFQVTF
jgi:hypothetical protein